MVNAIVSNRSDRFRLGSCEVEELLPLADEWHAPKDEEKLEKWRKALSYFDEHSYAQSGVAFYLEEFDGKNWVTIGFGTGGNHFDTQCREIIQQVMKETYICSCANGFKNWSFLPKAKSEEEFDLKLAALGI